MRGWKIEAVGVTLYRMVVASADADPRFQWTMRQPKAIYNGLYNDELTYVRNFKVWEA
jgi:hypothetical protein